MTQKRRLAWALALLFVVNIAVISLAQQAEAAIPVFILDTLIFFL